MLINSGVPFYGAGVLNAAMAQSLSMSKETLGLGFSIMSLCAGMSAPLVGMLIRRTGVRTAFVAGSLMLALGATCLATIVSTGWQYVLAFGLIVGVAAGLGATLAAQSTMALWFRQRRATAIAIVMTATGLGGFVIPPALHALVGPAGDEWRHGWFIVAALAVATALISWLFVKNSPEEIGEVPDGRIAVARAQSTTDTRRIHRSNVNWTVRAAMRTPAFWCATVGALAGSCAFFTYIAHGIVHLQSFGHTSAIGATSLSLLALFSLLGRLVAGVLSDRLEPRYVWGACLVLAAAGLFIVSDAPGRPAIYAFTVLMGVGYSGGVIAWAATLANYYGAVSYPAIVGAQGLILAPLSALAPVAAGALYERSGNYTAAFVSISMLLLVGGILMFLAKPPRAATRELN
jgi:sugar phosphate permease